MPWALHYGIVTFRMCRQEERVVSEVSAEIFPFSRPNLVAK